MERSDNDDDDIPQFGGASMEDQQVPEPEVNMDQMENHVDNFPAHMFTLQLHQTHSFKQFNQTLAQEFSYTAKLRTAIQDNNLYLGSILAELTHLFEVLLLEISYNYENHDLVRVYISHAQETGCNIIVGPEYLGDMTTQKIMDAITRVVRSNNFIPADQALNINVAAVKNLAGESRVAINNVWQDLKRKNCLIHIMNEDHLCLPRAIAVALARLHHKQDPTNTQKKKLYECMRKRDSVRKSFNKKSLFSHSSLQKRTALQYMKKADIPFHKAGLVTDVHLYERALGVGINIISARGNNKKLYAANSCHADTIYLYHIDEYGTGSGHYAVINKMNALLGRSYYCSSCDVGFNNNTGHSCFVWCNLCGSNTCIQQNNTVRCDVCNAPCRSANCLARHKAANPKNNNTSKCSKMFFCPHCQVSLKDKKNNRAVSLHVCGESYCKNCQLYYMPEQEHLCYMRATPTYEHSLLEGEWPKRFIFYDFESMQDAEGGVHIPNLVVCHTICEWCENETLVKHTSTCSSCGSRCANCSKLNKRKTFFENPPCEECGKREKIFKGEDTVEQFCQWLIHPQHKKMIAFAHNARAYDNYFIYNYLVNNSIKPDILFQGSKIMYCKIHNGIQMTFLDSLNFLPMALSQLPKSFGLDTLKKGYFPHLYNAKNIIQHEENTVLPHLPPLSYYDPDMMSAVNREKFMTWYEANYSKPFDFHQELLEYCRSDVNILLCACWKFREQVMDSTEVDPFNYVTIASLCMGIFRTNFLPETWSVLLPEHADSTCDHEWSCHCTWTLARKVSGNADIEVCQHDIWSPISEQQQSVVKSKFVSSPIALPPPHGYSNKDNYSKQALQWLHVFKTQYKHPISIQTAQHAEGEKKVIYQRAGRQFYYKLDGFFLDATGLPHAVEFYGCWWHGCPRCYPRDRNKLVINNRNMSQRYLDTTLKETTLKQLGYTLHTKWACAFEMDVKQSPHLQSLIAQLDIQDPINLRDCFYGGRTNALKLYHMFPPAEIGKWLDICSLYPFVLKYMMYPLGHPVKITSDFLPLMEIECNQSPETTCQYTNCKGTHLKLPYFGVYSVKVLPPRNLYHPVLPLRCNGKLMFPLCYTCAEQQQNGHVCSCTSEKRAIKNTYLSPELEVAVNMGYTILSTYEVLHWSQTTTLDQSTGEGGLFTNYINTFLQFKAEASGFPPHMCTEEQKEQYIEDYAEHEGVHLDKKNIKKNPGLRSLAKLCLNSFFGKFGQRTNMKKSLFLTDFNAYLQIVTDYSKKLCDFHVLPKNMMLVEYSNAIEFQEVDVKTNVIISAFCTSWARLELWKAMHKLQKRVMYHDTDCVIFSVSPDQYSLPTGEYLGDWTNELTCDKLNCKGCEAGHHIVEFVSCGPKNYALKLSCGQVIIKVKGFSLNFNASQVINFDSMKQVLLAWQNKLPSPEMITVKGMILRNKYEGIIYTKQVSKQYGLVYTKRVVNNAFETVPYGY